MLFENHTPLLLRKLLRSGNPLRKRQLSQLPQGAIRHLMTMRALPEQRIEQKLSLIYVKS